MKFTEMPYERVDKDTAIATYKKMTEDMRNAASAEEAWEVHQRSYEMENLMTDVILAEVRNSIDTTDEFYEQEKDFYDEFLPELEVYSQEYQKALYESPYREFLESKIGKVAFKNMEISFKAFDEKIVPLMQEENQLISRYSKLIATAKIPFRGQTYNISGLSVYTHDQDRQTRKEAVQALNDYFNSVTDEIDEIYDAMVKNRTQQARELGYENYIELAYYRMGRNCYDQNMVENFRRQVKEAFVPYVAEINKNRKERLGLEQLTIYDAGVYFKHGNPDPTGNPQEILKAGQDMYHEISPFTAEFMDFMMENELFDVIGRPTKQQGGYMTYLPKYKSPFIFANFNGTQSDLGVITHECGHAFQGYLLRDEKIREFAELSMETAEIHSMSMEYFTYKWMDKFFDSKEKAEEYRQMHFEDSSIFVPYGCMVDEFQHRVYANPDWTPAQRKECWKELEKSYRPDTDCSEMDFFANGGFWQKQGHIFENPFYYIDYVLASVCAMQFKVWMDKDFDEAWKNYLVVCKECGPNFFTDIIVKAGLDNPFLDGSIDKLAENLKKTYQGILNK